MISTLCVWPPLTERFPQGDQTTIQGLLEKIQAPWNSSIVADGPSGILMKERRRFGGWTQVHCVMRQNRMEWSQKQGVRCPRPRLPLAELF